MTFSAWLDRLLPRRGEPAVYWALDLETSGLKPATDRILAVGMVPIRHGVIRYGERYATLVRTPEAGALSTEGLRVHHILPTDGRDAPLLADVLDQVDRRVREGVLLLHFKALDLAFLKAAYRETGRVWPRPPLVDTVELVIRLHDRRQQWAPHPPPAPTALADAREALGLPAYPSHDALSDALATAELYLALRSHLGLCRLGSHPRY
jgi:DNA polymerase III subunit epsilon